MNSNSSLKTGKNNLQRKTITKVTALALGFGVATGLVVAITMTWMDWRLNPGGIFRHQEGTNWPIVLETALSWFVPILLCASVLALSVTCWRSRNKNEEK